MPVRVPRPPTPYPNRVPRLTGRALTDLRILMIGFGLLIGVVFPFAVIAMGVPRDVAIRPVFFAACILAGLLVGLVNALLVNKVVGVRLRALSSGMKRAQAAVREAGESGHWSSDELQSCRLPIDSDDELGESASAFNQLVEGLTESQLRNTQWQAIIGNAPLGVAVRNPRGGFEFANPAFSDMLGLDPDTVLGRPPEDIFDDHGFLDVVTQAEAEAIRDGTSRLVEQRLPSGAIHEFRIFAVRDPHGDLLYLCGLGMDVTQRVRAVQGLERANQRLEYLTERDPLTGFLNRRGFLDRTSRALEECALRNGSSDQRRRVAVMFIDLDGFKNVNDVYGHRIGDGFLRAVADRLDENTRAEGGQVGRIGGDEFVVLFDSVEPSQASELARRLERCVRQPMIVDTATLAVSCAVGQAVSVPGIDAEGMLARADQDMYAVRNARVVGLAEKVERLRHAVDSGHLVTYFQPVWALGAKGHTLKGYEALVRWRDPELGLIPPDEFIPVAEAGGLIATLDLWVANQALRGLAGRPEISIAVNCSALTLAADGAVRELIAAIAAVGRHPNSVIVELTESVDIPDNSQILNSLDTLRRAGVRIALDDFGAGYAGLNNLRTLPIDIVKIDRSLIATLSDQSGQAEHTEHFLAGIRQLTGMLGTQLLAEGIENERQLDLVCRLGFDYAQGYFLGRPDSDPCL